VLLEDYGLIGDLESAALVARNGAIDWLCLPRFDCGSCLSGLLGYEQHGRWRLAPAGEVRATTRRSGIARLVPITCRRAIGYGDTDAEKGEGDVGDRR
jgi:GH15 family glucan-1,4-alpha-glucosidase